MLASPGPAERSPEGDADDFRERVLPILRARCFECHGPGATRIRGKLRMNGQASLLAGGASGPAIVPGDPDASLLIQAVRYADPDFAMPPKERLDAEEIAVLEAWVAAGAPWPEDPHGPERAVFEHGALQYFEDQVRPLLAQHCAQCHGHDVLEPKSGLRMSSRAALLAGGDRGPALVPGDPDASLLVRAVRYGDSALQMPPTGKLDAEAILVLERWVALGAPWPDTDLGPPIEEHEIDVEAGRVWWSFRPVARPEVPAVARGELVQNPIDAFVLARLEEAGLDPSPPASEAELVRRAHFDLVGLPPTHAEIAAYVADPAPDKWERLIERLLARPEYGERWARHWLDVVRFAQTNGYERDAEKPHVWRYRDWVIDSFNQDKPFDRFLSEQLAGDELDDAGPEALVATGFYHLGTYDSEPDDKEQAVYDGYDDVLRAIGEGMLGVTVACARCHDHKFDPIRQRDYYGLLAFVRNVKPYTRPTYSLDSDTYAPLLFTPELAERWEEERAEHVRQVEAQQREILEARRNSLIEEIVAAQSPEVGLAYRLPPEERSAAQRRLLASLTHLAPTEQAVHDALEVRDRQRLFLLKEEVERSASSFEGSLPWALVAREGGPEARPTHVLGRGRVDVPLEPVEPTFVPVLCPDEAATRPAVPPPDDGSRSTGLRRALADWIASPAHPTTARVIANRVFQHHFGRGLVRTPNDFGATGMPPTHPELLDWLASELVRQGWSLKALHRTVMGSYVYRMSSRAEDGAALAKDAPNDLFWRQNPRRLEAEALRDSILAVSGRLHGERGGRGFFPELSREALAGASKPGDGWELSDERQRDRRTVYAFVKRGMQPPLLELFDFADPAMPIGARARTTTASQALTLLNSDFMSRMARALADRVRAEAGDEPGARVERLFQVALGRGAAPEELALAREHLERATRNFAALPERIEFRSKMPPRLQTRFLASLPDDGFFHGPRAGWRYVRGHWDAYYNDTFERDPDRGPAALLDAAHFADGAVRVRVRMDPGCEVAGLALRARADRGELVGLELALDPAAGEARLTHLRGPDEEPRVLLRKEAALAPGRWYQVELEVAGARLGASIDGQPLFALDPVPVTEAGSFAVRTYGDVLALEDLTLRLADGDLAVTPGERRPPEQRAFESLCLAVLNLDEFLYVD